jgi:hypothetical protein
MGLTRVVVDSNFLRSPDLVAFLAAKPTNHVVLTEFILMEQHRSSNPLHTVRESLALCSKFAAQVIVLKRSPEILRLSTRSEGLQRRMIDFTQTSAFPDYCSALCDPNRKGQVDSLIARRAAESAQHMALLLDDCKYLPEIYGRISGGFTNGELIEIRQRRPFRRTTQFKLLDAMFEESRRLYLATNVEEQYWPKTVGDAVNSYPFRYAVCMMLHYMRWVRDGEPQRAVQKLRNDIVDVNTAAFATFFDGLLSRDGNLTGIHAEARYISERLDGYVGAGRR